MEDHKRTRRCGLYARVSTDRQANVIDGSLDQQRDSLQSDIENRMRLGGTGVWQVHDLYVDEGESGKSLDRPAMQRMIADIRAGKVDTVITPKLYRISRSLPDFYILLKLFQENGVEFICLRERFDTTTSTGRAVLKMMLVFAELEREQTSERTKDAMLARSKKGLRNGGRVWGYDLNKDRPGVYLVSDQQKHDIHKIFDTYERAKSCVQVIAKLKEEGIRPPAYKSRRGMERGGAYPTKQTVINILRNRFYIGEVRHGETWYKGEHQAIIDPEQFERVQALLAHAGEFRRQRALKDGSKPYVYLLRGIIRCGLCGNVMTPKPGKDAKRYPYYVCTRVANYGGDGCDAPHLPAQAIEEHFLSILRGLSTDEERLKVLVSRSTELQNKTMQELERDSQRIQREKSKLQERIAPFVEAIEQGGASASRSVMDRLSKLEAELEDLERGAEKVEQRREELRAKMSDYDTVVRAYRGLAEALKSDEDRESLSDLVATIVEQITWTPATDPTGKHKYSGGSYDYILFDNPLLSHEFKKARRLEMDESSSYGQDWLPRLGSNQRPTD
ncbi:recombinase family protein [soil metagenome]